jgi:hypothetical protein
MPQDYRKIYESQLLGKRIKSLITELGIHKCIGPDGNLNDAFILAYLIKCNKPTATEYNKLVAAFAELRKSDVFTNFNPIVKKSTLKTIELYSEYLVRPDRTAGNRHIDNIYTGTIIKLPKKLASDYFPSEGWKASLDDPFQVGDQIIYNCRSSIILDHEHLHLVGYFVGKILVQNNNS